VSAGNGDSAPPLGRQVSGSDSYDPGQLYPIARDRGRAALGLSGADLPFCGEDVWHAYELSWLEPSGRPRVALGLLVVPATSPYIIESKSLKLYLNSLNGSAFADPASLRATIADDLRRAAGAPVAVELLTTGDRRFHGVAAPGDCVDELDYRRSEAPPGPGLLECSDGIAVEETLHSHLLRSLCPVTAQPDWATLVVRYRGRPLRRESLLRYVVAFRRHQEFHEQCVERIFLDLKAALNPEQLSVQALYTRRGGMDISPWRSSEPGAAPRYRLHRQ
jgi:7-cyano-7-deazaguanine reductase